MSIKELLEKAMMHGYASAELDFKTIFICIGITAVISLYIGAVYKTVNKNSFFDRSFYLSVFALAILTAMVILTIQSNIIVSLGMVGALSIVRFRTAIKSPADLVFLFWSISVGIICGAGFAMIAVIGSVILTVGIVLFSVAPGERESMVLVVNSSEQVEGEINDIVEKLCSYAKVRARNITRGNVNLAIEVKLSRPAELVGEISRIEKVTSVSLVEHDGEITA